MNHDLTNFRNGLEELHIDLSDRQMEQFLTYYEMLVEKNKVMNLTAITEFDEVVEKHFLDSLSLTRVKDLSNNLSVIDLGTGAGFPGIPLKIAFPELEITLVDSLNKRVLFLQEVISTLGLKNISTVHERAEIIANNPNFREKFDLCVSRAVANLSTLTEYCLPFVKIGGQFISYKSGECDEEVEAARNSIFLVGGKTVSVDKFTLGESGRAFVVIDKIKKTPKQYPRKAGTPAKEPL
jgi:16S rRNA (guanine527-N7)-methyltransferase